jgi:hypothetical protein
VAVCRRLCRGVDCARAHHLITIRKAPEPAI